MSTQDIWFITDAAGRKTHAVLPIALYESLLALSPMVKATAKPGGRGIYTLSQKGLIATGYPEGVRSAPDFVLIKDSEASLEAAPSLPEHVKALREKYLGDGTFTLCAERSCFKLSRDLRLKSPSLAAALITGSVRNGLDCWVNREGFSLKASGYGIKRKKKRA